MSLFVPIFEALNHANARYVVVGGVATVLHGYARFTADLDLIVDFSPPAVLAAVQAFATLGLRPRAPVALADFADGAKRRSWVEDKGLTVFSLWDPAHPMREVDLFVTHPLPFDDLWAKSEVVALGNTSVRVASIEHLIELKRLADRPEDRVDIEALTAIRQAKEKG